MLIRVLWFVILALLPSRAAAQAPEEAPACGAGLPLPASLAGIRADYLRVAELTGATPLTLSPLRRLSDLRVRPPCETDVPGLWRGRATESQDGLAVAPVRSQTTYNSEYPRDRNNGALWAGRGTASSLSAGLTYRRGSVSGALVPTAVYAQNRPFRDLPAMTAGYSDFSHPWHGPMIDWPQRFGNDEIAALHPGPSYVRFDGGTLAFGASTENLWIGPARRNPILMSNTAPGFPHAFLGTTRPLETAVGGFALQAVAGALDESEYWDGEPDNDRRLFTAFALGYRPRWAPGLQLGTARVYQEPVEWGRVPVDRVLFNLVDLPFVDVGPGDRGNEITSLFARWVFPAAGFEAYGEWAREEDPESILDLLMEPDYSQGYMLGAQKVIPGERLWWRLWGELTHLGPSTPVIRGRAEATYYTTPSGGQGHTHQGQLLGAWIGPGSETQALGLDLFHPLGLVGVYGERVRFDDATYYRVWARAYGEARHDVEVTVGTRAAILVGAFEASIHAAWSLRYDRQWVALDGAFRDPFQEENRMLEAVLSWSP